MVPTYFVELPELPLLPSGKIDRNSLKEPGWQSSSPDSSSEAPNGEFEILLAAAWKQLLHVDTIGRHDSFFELGGHSMLATQLATLVRQQTDVELPCPQYSTVRQ
ncbi:MAG: hypothetical protein CMO26_03185 [Thiotrichales bacterium]|nr:hypothetical protein [Thiotrichales bacterium]